MYVVYYYDVAMSMYAGEARLTAEIPQRDRLGCRSGFTPTCPPKNSVAIFSTFNNNNNFIPVAMQKTLLQ